jgi:uncharacterized protein YecA (UPF0149 family)
MPPKIDLKEEADKRVRNAFGSAIRKGMDTGMGFVMQCNKDDYQSMNDGLAIYLSTPVEEGGAGGDKQRIVAIRDKSNNANYQTIETAQYIALQMMKYYWMMWARKGAYRDALANCKSVAEMDSIVF